MSPAPDKRSQRRGLAHVDNDGLVDKLRHSTTTPSNNRDIIIIERVYYCQVDFVEGECYKVEDCEGMICPYAFR
jgi:hypothetical protein